MKASIITLASLGVASVLALQAASPPNLVSHKPFSGLAYSPFIGNQSPNLFTYPTVDQITYDLTNAVRYLATEITIYGMDGTLSNIPAICNTYDILCYPCAFLGTDLADNTNELNALIAIGNSNYPTTRGLVVGTEALLHGYDHLTLISNLNYVRAATHTNVPVGIREDPGSIQGNPDVIAAADFVMADIYAYWAEIPITNAVEWTLEQWQYLTRIYPGKNIMIGEANWPSGGTNIYWSDPKVVTSVSNQSIFLSQFVSMAESNHIEYFIFDYRDEAWKIQTGSGNEETNWGVTYGDSTKKASLVNFLSTNFTMNMVSAHSNIALVSVQTFEGNPYSLYCSTNLRSGWFWIANFIATPGTNQTVLTLINTGNTNAGFYRALQDF
jgi:exo-beta-1,3-glucanase (GH17 family)